MGTVCRLAVAGGQGRGEWATTTGPELLLQVMNVLELEW